MNKFFSTIASFLFSLSFMGSLVAGKLDEVLYNENIQATTSFIKETVKCIAEEIKKNKSTMTTEHFLSQQEIRRPYFIHTIEQIELYQKTVKYYTLLLQRNPELNLYIPQDFKQNFVDCIDKMIKNKEVDIGQWFEEPNTHIEPSKDKKADHLFSATRHRAFRLDKTDITLILGPFK